MLPQLYLEELHTQDFRNLREQILKFHPKLTVIQGNNGQGKTNILEAIFTLLRGKSFRKNTDFAQLLSMSADRPKFLLQGRPNVMGKAHAITQEWEMRVDQKVYKRISFDGESQAKLSKFPCIMVQPQSAYMFFNYAQERREWLDHAIEQQNLVYGKILKKFEKLKYFKSQLLKKGNPLRYDNLNQPELLSQINFLNLELARVSKLITLHRCEFLEKINDKVIHNFQKLFDQSLILNLQLSSLFVGKTETDIVQMYSEKWQDEWKRQKILIGPHLDDLCIQSRLGSFENNASMGQQKMAFLSLQFALLSHYVNIFQGMSPILLLDDISSELDSERWKNLIEYLRSYPIQMMMTTARANGEILPIDESSYSLITVNNGRLESNQKISEVDLT